MSAMPYSLCETCASMREVITPKGSCFLLCQLSKTDPAFPKYPPQPVVRCDGYRPRDGEGAVPAQDRPGPPHGERVVAGPVKAGDQVKRAGDERGPLTLPLYEEPHFTFRFAEARLIPRFRLEGVAVGRRVSVFQIDPGSGERLGLLATASVGDGGWVDLTKPIVVRAGEAFVAVPGPG